MRFPWIASAGIHVVLVTSLVASNLRTENKFRPEMSVMLCISMKPAPMTPSSKRSQMPTTSVFYKPEPEIIQADFDSFKPAEIQEKIVTEDENAVSFQPEAIEMPRAIHSPPVQVKPPASQTCIKPAVALAGNPSPRYPRVARKAGLEGKLLIRLLIGTRGRVISCEFLRRSGVEILDRAALAALKRWHFIPGQGSDGPVESFVTVPVQFSINSRG